MAFFPVNQALKGLDLGFLDLFGFRNIEHQNYRIQTENSRPYILRQCKDNMFFIVANPWLVPK